MLACLPASGDPTTQLLSHTQMNTGLQKWETTQKMRSVKYPTPAELDAYAKKIANNPLTIKIFPNSVKVPQRKHIRRTVNGLDTSTSGQRHSPYQSQVSAKAGLLAVLRVPAKSIVKEADGSRAPLLSKSTMNPHNSGQYITQSTLNLSQPVPHLQGLSQPQAQTLAAQKQGLPHPQAFQQQQTMARPMTSQQPQTMPHHPAIHQRNMAHPQALQRQQSLSQLQTLQPQQSLPQPQSIQRQQSLPHTQTLQKQQSQPQPQTLQQQQRQQQQQHLAHPQTLQQQQTLPHQQAILQQHGLAQGMRHMSDAAQQLSLQNSQVPPPSQSLPQATGAGPPPTPNAPLQQLPSQGPYGPRKLPDADAPPNVTVSTSTIPLSMAASLHQNRPGDLSSIVLQINQFCQARAGMGGTSVCEGQIANPSPISRNLLISASSRVSTHNPALGPLPSCLLGGLQDTAPSQASAGAVVPQPNMAAMTRMPAFHSDIEQQQLQQQLQQQQQQLQQHQLQQQQQHHHQQQLQQQLQQQRSWNQHQLAHMQQPPEGVHPCKNPRMEALTGPGFPTKNLNYPHKLCASQSFPLRHPANKPTSSPSVKGPDMPFTNGQYMQPPWGGVLPGPNNNGSGPQEHPLSFQGGQGGTSLDCTPGPQYRGAPPAQSKLMQNVEHLGGEFQAPCFREQNLGAIGKMHRPTMGRAPEPSNGRNVHAHHPGYR